MQDNQVHSAQQKSTTTMTASAVIAKKRKDYR